MYLTKMKIKLKEITHTRLRSECYNKNETLYHYAKQKKGNNEKIFMWRQKQCSTMCNMQNALLFFIFFYPCDTSLYRIFHLKTPFLLCKLDTMNTHLFVYVWQSAFFYFIFCSYTCKSNPLRTGSNEYVRAT